MNTPALFESTALAEVVGALGHLNAWIAILVALACLGLSWFGVRLLRGQFQHEPGPSIWFGRRIVDGVLFPALALGLVFIARRVVFGLGYPVAAFKIVIPILMSFAIIRLSVRVLTAAFPQSPLLRQIERTISWLAWLAMVGWITGVLPQVLEELDQIHWQLGKSTISIRTMLEGLLSAGFVLMLMLWVSAEIESRLLKGAVGEQLSLRKAAANLVRALLTFIGLLLAMSLVGIDLTALSVLGGAVGVGLGLGLQRLAANYVSGFVILAERSVRIGDLVRIGGFEGRITDITTRYTVVRSAAGGEAIVPNETLITTTVENLSLADPSILLSTQVSVAYGTDVQALRAQIVDAVRQVDRVLQDPGPAAHLTAFGADGLDLTVFFWIRDAENGQGNARSEVNLAILALFNRLGIDIPYPQRVLRMVPDGAADALAAAAQSKSASSTIR
ncbi:mechanosensitive ion channel family protein [Ideonella sp.]|uniref:mechanosensitive ion channel family protein n=1 Tax=Ideonella sp. TaxID=1929293 RepID=UPI003BB5F4D8